MEPPLRISPDDIHSLVPAGDAIGLTRVLRFAHERSSVLAAHHALVGLGEQAVAPLVAAMRDEPTTRGQRVWWTLMRIGEPAQDQVADCLRSCPTPAIRAGAAWVLGYVGERCVDRHLVRALDDHDLGVKLAAALMLGFRSCPQAVPALLRILTGGHFDDPAAPHPDQLALPLPGVEAYGEVADGPRCGGHDSHPGPRAARSLDGLVPYARGLADDVEAYLAVHDGPDDADCPAAHESREPFVPRWVVEPWCYFAVDDVREAAVLSLERIGDSRAVDALVQCAEDLGEPVELRGLAIEALGSIGDQRGFDAVYGALREEALEPDALYALGGFADLRALSPLKRAALSGDGIGRISAIGGLASLGDRATLPYLRRLTGDPDSYVVGHALLGLAMLGSQTALESVVVQITHVDPEVRRQAAAALRWAHDRRSGQGAGSIWHP